MAARLLKQFWSNWETLQVWYVQVLETDIVFLTVDVDSICKKNKTSVIADPFNCAQYYDCSKKSSALGKPYLKECHYPDLFSSLTNTCEPFSKVTGSCGRRKEVQAPCKKIFLTVFPLRYICLFLINKYVFTILVHIYWN